MIYFEEKNNLSDSGISTRENALEKIDTRWLTRFLTLSGLAIFLPFFIHLPWITGPIINAILILALLLTGRRSALVIACLPSLMALASGLLPAVLAPAVPFIIISNFIFIMAVDWFYKRARTELKGYCLGVGTGAFLKFIFLFIGVNLLATFFITTPVISIIEKMLGWSQLITALAGGVIAFGVLKFLKYFK